MRRVLLVATLAMFCARADAGILYQQPPRASGGFYHSSWWDPDGSNYDEYVWDKFVLGYGGDINTIQWRGAYDPSHPVALVVNFTVGIYGSIPGGSEPDVSHPPLVEYEAGDNAGETYAGVFGGVTMYDYKFTLPSAFHAQAGVPYWVHVEGWQWAFPNWSIARGDGGDGSHFRCQHVTDGADLDVPTGCYFTRPSGDAAFTLLTNAATDVNGAQGPADFALGGARPNPSGGDRLDVSFSLPDAAQAELALFDVGGRCLVVEDVGGLGAGLHVANLAQTSPIEPGIYFARLSQGANSRVTKVVVTR